MQFGPIIRAPAAVAVAANSRWSRVPSSPSSLNPAAQTVMAGIPRAAHCSTASGTRRAGTTTTAASMSSSISARLE